MKSCDGLVISGRVASESVCSCSMMASASLLSLGVAELYGGGAEEWKGGLPSRSGSSFRAANCGYKEEETCECGVLCVCEFGFSMVSTFSHEKGSCFSINLLLRISASVFHISKHSFWPSMSSNFLTDTLFLLLIFCSFAFSFSPSFDIFFLN